MCRDKTTDSRTEREGKLTIKHLRANTHNLGSEKGQKQANLLIKPLKIVSIDVHTGYQKYIKQQMISFNMAG